MLTIVSALLPGLEPDRGEHLLATLSAIFRSAHLPLVLYADPELTPVKGEDFGDAVCLRATDEAGLRKGLWLNDEFHALRQAQGVSIASQLQEIARLRTMGWLHDESIFNPFGSDTFLWMDAATLANLNPAYLGEDGPLAAMAPLLDRVLLLARPDAETPDDIVPGLFGGNAGTLSAVNQAYWQRYADTLAHRRIPSFAGLMSELSRTLPDHFSRFMLQSNGLAGALFESVRGGRVCVERTHIAG